MKKSLFKGIALLVLALTVLIGFTACPSGSTGGGSGSGGGSVSPVVPEGFKEVAATPNGETTTENASASSPTNPTVNDLDDWKGAFTTGRKVKLSPYAIGETEVTYEQWYEVRVWAEGKGYVFANKGLEGWDGTGGGGSYPNYTNIGQPPTPNKKYPVTMVSWRDCIVWCNAYTEMKNGNTDECVYRVSNSDPTVLKDATVPAQIDSVYYDKSKKGFRLPTEAEWEWAARYQGSNSTNAVAYGSKWLTKLNSASGASAAYTDADETKKVAWYGANSGNKIQEVGTTEMKNALGLSDMSGNVWEWCFDWYSGDATDGDTGSPGTEQTDPIGAASGSLRVLRSGIYDINAQNCVVGRRGGNSPDKVTRDGGLRLCRSL